MIEGDYAFHGSTHAPIEPHCAVASYSPDGLLTVWSSTQITHYVQKALARVLEIPESKVRVVQPCLGGAFGGKSDPFSLEFCVALLAMKTGARSRCCGRARRSSTRTAAGTRCSCTTARARRRTAS